MERPFPADTIGVRLTRTSRNDAARLILGGAVVVLGAVWVAWLGFRTQVMGDYRNWFAPSTNALLSGHVGSFFSLLPTDGAGGSVLLRAPFAFLGKELVGGQHAIFRLGALACVLATVAAAMPLVRTMRESGRPPLARIALIALFLLTPAVLDAIFFGHPEEGLGAALCLGSVLCAASGRSEFAGGLLGLAIINKPWGVLAILPALLAAPRGRLRLLGVAGLIAGGWTAATYAGSPSNFRHSLRTSSSAVVAHPQDLWWPLARLHVAAGTTPWYSPPALIGAHARMLAVLVSMPLAVPIARRRERTVDDAIALLALLFLLRCVLDPSNHVYYQVPFVLALAAWEARTRGTPLLSLVSLGGFWFIFHMVSGTGSLTAQFLAYMALVTPLAGYLAAVILGGRMGIVHWSDRHRLGPGISRGVAS
jgi:Glycosyltransferase family 87